MAILRPEKDKDKDKRPRILLIPPPDLPVPAVQGGAVETLLTHLIRENERQGRLDLLCASVPDDAARRAAEGLQHTKILYIARPHGHRRYWPLVFLERCLGIAAPYDPWYQKVQLSLALELPAPDLIVAEGGNLTQCSAISRMFGRRRCLAHLHGQTACSPVMDTIYGGILALSRFIRDDYLKNSTMNPRNAYIWYNCVDTQRFRPGPPPLALRTRLPGVTLECACPCETQAHSWPAEEQARYQNILERCDYETMVQQRYDRFCMMRRNRYMVDHAAHILTVYNGVPQGGTAQTLQYAIRKGLLVHPIPLEEDT